MTIIRVTTTTSVVRVTDLDTGDVVRVTGANTPVVRVADIGIQGPPGSRLVELCLAVDGTVPPGRIIHGYLASSPVDLIPTSTAAHAGTANLADTTITVRKNNTVIGTVTFAAGQQVGVVTISAASLAPGDLLKYYFDNAINSLADVVISILANRPN